MEWHVWIRGSQSGPHPEHYLLAWAYSGQLAPDDLVWSSSMPAWLPAGQVPPFAGVYAGTPMEVQPPERLGDDPLMRALFPVGRSAWAIASGYLGLFSVLLLPAPLALITGVVAVFDIQRHSHRHGIGRAIFGIMMGTLFSAVLVLFLLIEGV